MSVSKSVAVTFAGKYAQLITALATSIILARLLTPEDFGIYSIAASLVLIGHLFRNFGAGQFIIQVDELNDDMLRAAFSISLLLSWGIGCMILLAAPFVAEWYQHNGVETVLSLLSVNFFLLPFGAVADAVLRRQMAFGKIAIVVSLSALVGLVVAVVAALYGHGYLAIAWSSIATTVVTVLATLYYRPDGLPWLPGVKAIGSVLAFGAKVGSLNLVTKGSDTATELIIGRLHGLHLLGIYSRAYGTFQLFSYAFVEAVKPVVLPYLSEAKREKQPLAPIYLQIAQYLSVFVFPFFVFLYLYADSIIALLYGDQWDDAVSVLRVMCLAGLFILPSIFFDQILIAKGRPGLALKYQMAAHGMRLLSLAIFVTSGLEAAAIAIVIEGLTKGGLALLLAKQMIRVSLFEYLKKLAVGVGISFLLVVIESVVSVIFPPDGTSFVHLSLMAMLSAFCWLFVLWLVRHPLLSDVLRLLARRGAD